MAESGNQISIGTTQSVSTEDYDFGALGDIAEEFKDATTLRPALSFHKATKIWK